MANFRLVTLDSGDVFGKALEIPDSGDGLNPGAIVLGARVFVRDHTRKNGDIVYVEAVVFNASELDGGAPPSFLREVEKMVEDLEKSGAVDKLLELGKRFSDAKASILPDLATSALNGLLANPAPELRHLRESPAAAVQLAWEHAEAMLAEHERRKREVDKLEKGPVVVDQAVINGVVRFMGKSRVTGREIIEASVSADELDEQQLAFEDVQVIRWEELLPFVAQGDLVDLAEGNCFVVMVNREFESAGV